MEAHEDEEIYDDAVVAKEKPSPDSNTAQSPPAPPSAPSGSSANRSETPAISVKDRLKMFADKGDNNNSNGFPVGLKPILPKKPVTNARPTQSPQKLEHDSKPLSKPPKPVPTAFKPPPSAAKPALKSPPFAKDGSSTNLLSELKTRQNSLKAAFYESDSGKTYRKLRLTAGLESDRPAKPESIQIEDVDLPDCVFGSSITGCKDENSAPVRTNNARQMNDESHKFDSEKIKSLTEEEELALDGGSGGGSSLLGGRMDSQDTYDDGKKAESIEEELYDICENESPGPNSPDHLQNGVAGGSKPSLSLKEQSRIDKEKSRKELKTQKKLQEKEKNIQKEQDKIRKKYKLTDEEISSNDIVRCAKQMNEGKNLPFGLNVKQAVFLVKKVEKDKMWVIKNKDGKLGVVDASMMEMPAEEVPAEAQDGFDEDVYEEVGA